MQSRAESKNWVELKHQKWIASKPSMCQKKLSFLQTFDVILGKLKSVRAAKTFSPRCSMHNLMEPQAKYYWHLSTLIFALHAMFSLNLSQWDIKIDFTFTPL